MKKVDTFANIKKRALPILRRHAVKHAAIFGSFARGTAKTSSDVDFLIEYKGKNKTLFDLVDLKSELEDILGRKVDIVTYNSIYKSPSRQKTNPGDSSSE